MDTGNRKQKAEGRTAIFYITENGQKTAQKINSLYPDASVIKFKKEDICDPWNKCSTFIFIMATGIVMRVIAPLIRSKKTDPAVIVLDEKGRFAISLLSGHLGGANKVTKEVADFLDAEAVITTASDVNNLTSIDLWAEENNLVIENWSLLPQIGTRLINNGLLRIYTEIEMKLPDEFLRIAEPMLGDVLITNKNDVYVTRSLEQCPANSCCVKGQLYLCPKNLVIGIGCNSGTSEGEIEEAVKSVLNDNNLSFLSIYSLATIDIKCKEDGLLRFAQRHGFAIIGFKAEKLNAVEGIVRSEAVFKATGAHAVSEPAAILASGASGLLVLKRKKGNVTIALAEIRESGKTSQSVTPKLYIVGTGPGHIEHITPYAQDVIRRSDVIVGYGTYLALIQELIKNKEIVSTGMTHEIDRCKKAVEMAMSGKTVSVISSGDPGIYAMAGLVFEIIRAQGTEHRAQSINVEVIPGISALSACASRLGAPLMHDFACISLSDRLTSWETIEKRLEAVAIADFVIALYNPKSMGRPEHINKAQAIFLKYRCAETPVGIVTGAMRENERVIVTSLRDMLNYDIDMQTTVIIGNSQTFTWDNRMITPRGYERKSQ